ncbi:MAG: 50S ribosomal protein L9 [Candidatus Dojkabacteria bacterium]|nr:50S ribosomal protein L9 [Candidatus Dojkabacteria bacterium]
MKVILLQDVATVGSRGDVVEVSPGYGINYLLPRGLAVSATADALQNAQNLKQRKMEKQNERRGIVDRISGTAANKSVQITAKASKGGRLYGSLSQTDLVTELEKAWDISGKGVSVTVDLAQPIHEVGKYPLEIELSDGSQSRKFDMVVSVVAE